MDSGLRINEPALGLIRLSQTCFNIHRINNVFSPLMDSFTICCRRLSPSHTFLPIMKTQEPEVLIIMWGTPA